ncbi:MAG: ATP-binding cassette domain-containing protein, partial [Pseudomonadota bacterium]
MQLIAENLACDRGDTRIFEGVSFALKSGEGMLVTGPNGAGKSSLLRVIAGFLPAATGTVTCDGNAIAQFSHYLGPQNGMKPALTVSENLEFWQNYFGIA